MSAPWVHTSAVPIRSAQITKDLTTAHVIARDYGDVENCEPGEFRKVLFRVDYNIQSLTNDEYFT